MEPNKTKVFKKLIYFNIISIILVGVLANIILAIIVGLNHNFSLIIGFNIGFGASLVGYLMLLLASHLMFKNSAFPGIMSFIIFLVRILFYSIIILLMIFYPVGNIIMTIVGLSAGMIATFISAAVFHFSSLKEGIENE